MPSSTVAPSYEEHLVEEDTLVSNDSGDSLENEEQRTPAQLFADAVEGWKDELGAIIRDRSNDNLPSHFLGNAHPGGLAQLYAHHPTRLQNLVRESASYKRALEGARRIISRQNELSAQHGVAPAHLAIGYASWVVDGIKQTSPAILRPLHLEDDGTDVILTMGKKVRIGPGLAHISAASNVPVDAVHLRRFATTGEQFSPSKAFQYITSQCEIIEGFTLRDELSMGIYEHPANRLLQELEADKTLAGSAIVRALAGDDEVIQTLTAPLPEGNPFDRDPWKERGIGDLTPQQHDLLEAISQGRSIHIRSQHGSTQDALLSSILAEAAAKGRSTAFVARSRSRLKQVEGALEQVGIAQTTVRIDGSVQDTQALRDRLIEALDAQSAVYHTDSDTDQMRLELTQARRALADYTTHLHAPFHQFGVSAMDALQVLTDLTLRTPAPRTKVRLREDVLAEIAHDQGESAREILHRAEALGMYTRASVHSAWSGAVIDAPEQVDIVVQAARRLATQWLPEMRNLIEKTALESRIGEAKNIRQWEAQLHMLQGVQEALDVFKPEIFERSAADMVIATAPSQWRKERGIMMKRSQRVRLTKHAKDLLLPGRHVDDLHRELVLVQEKRELWRKISNADGWPMLPTGLSEALSVTQSVVRDLDVMTPALATGYENLFDMNIAELQRLMDRLAADPEGAAMLPKRVEVLKDATAAGIDLLLTDLRQRHVTGEMIDNELDLAWWASMLGVILASDSAFQGISPLRLGELLDQTRELDEQQVRTLLPQALQNVQRRRQHVMAARGDQYEHMREFLDRGIQDAADLYSRSTLVSLLVSTVLTLPALIPSVLAPGQEVDLLVLDDMGDTPISQLVPILSRARQVILFSSDMPRRGTAEIARVLPSIDLAPEPSRLNDQIVRLMSHHGLPHTGVPQPWAMSAQPVNALWVEASGMPSPGASAVESTAAEVSAILDLLIDHALRTPERSVAVIALNAMHASRLREAVAKAVAQQSVLAEFFDPSKPEPFAVVDLAHAEGLSRDRIVIAVGYAKTPHGRIMHDFGVLSTPEGISAMASALRCIRDEVTVVSAIRASELDPDRLYTQGTQIFADLLGLAEGQLPIAPGSWPVLEREPDRLLLDLADRLYSMGLEVIPNVGVEGGRRIPLAIGHPALPERLLVAVLTDDAEYVSQPSMRVRDRLWPQMLRDQGWDVFMAMSLAVFTDPTAVAQQIVHRVLDAVECLTEPLQGATGVEETPLVAPTEIAPEEQAVLDATNDARARHDEALTGMIQIIQNQDDGTEEESGGHSNRARLGDSARERAPRPPIARGLPLAAYGDDQLDELAEWVRSDGVERQDEELVELLRKALGVTRRGTQTDAVLANVVRRTRPHAEVDAKTHDV